MGRPPEEPWSRPSPRLAPRRMVQEQCCHSQLEELHCATGINLASEQDSCSVLPSNASLEAVFVKVSPAPPTSRGPSALPRHPSSRPPFFLSSGGCPIQEGGGTPRVSLPPSV